MNFLHVEVWERREVPLLCISWASFTLDKSDVVEWQMARKRSWEKVMFFTRVCPSTAPAPPQDRIRPPGSYPPPLHTQTSVVQRGRYASYRNAFFQWYIYAKWLRLQVRLKYFWRLYSNSQNTFACGRRSPSPRWAHRSSTGLGILLLWARPPCWSFAPSSDSRKTASLSWTDSSTCSS